MLSFQKSGFCRVIDITAGPELELSQQLADACEAIAWDDQARAVVLAFDGGIKLQTPEPVARLKQPVIAAIRGDAVGFGLELAMACDVRIGAEDARFGLDEIRQGIIPSHGGTQRLPRLVGYGKAMHMILTGEVVDAREALRSGLINRAMPADALMNAAMEMAGEMAAKSPLSLSYSKEALHNGRDLALDQGLRMELDLYLLLFSTQDRVEGITAFKENRKPDFKGE